MMSSMRHDLWKEIESVRSAADKDLAILEERTIAAHSLAKKAV